MVIWTLFCVLKLNHHLFWSLSTRKCNNMYLIHCRSAHLAQIATITHALAAEKFPLMLRRGPITLTFALRQAAESMWGAKILHFCPFICGYFNYALAPNNTERSPSDITAQWGWEITREISDLRRLPRCLMWPSHEYKFAAWQLDSLCRFPHEKTEQWWQNGGEIHPWMSWFIIFMM